MNILNNNNITKQKPSRVLSKLNELKNIVKARKYIYHSSPCHNRDYIEKHWLKARDKTDSWIADTNIDWKALFFSNTNDINSFFDSWYDDDIYKIYTSELSNIFFKDPNFTFNTNLIYCKWDIPKCRTKLIYKWRWNSCENWLSFNTRLKNIWIE